MYSAYKLNKQGDNIPSWCTLFPIWRQSIVPHLVLTVASWLAYKFLRRQVRWSGISIFLRIFHSFFVIHTVKGFSVVNEAEVDVFLELSCFFYDPVDAGNLISGSSAFSKSSLNIWEFSVHILLKPGLENFAHLKDMTFLFVTYLYTLIKLEKIFYKKGKKKSGWPVDIPGVLFERLLVFCIDSILNFYFILESSCLTMLG